MDVDKLLRDREVSITTSALSCRTIIALIRDAARTQQTRGQRVRDAWNDCDVTCQTDTRHLIQTAPICRVTSELPEERSCSAIVVCYLATAIMPKIQSVLSTVSRWLRWRKTNQCCVLCRGGCACAG